MHSNAQTVKKSEVFALKCTNFLKKSTFTIKNADIILVVKDGRVTEQGTHDELLALGGFYSTLYNSQFA